jgi:hypothetical protein
VVKQPSAKPWVGSTTYTRSLAALRSFAAREWYHEAAGGCDALLVGGWHDACIRCLFRTLLEIVWVSVLFLCCCLLGLASA